MTVIYLLFKENEEELDLDSFAIRLYILIEPYLSRCCLRGVANYALSAWFTQCHQHFCGCGDPWAQGL
jgi:hypothetical protein